MLNSADISREHPSYPILHFVDPDENFLNEVMGGLHTSNESKYFTMTHCNSTFTNTSIYIDFMPINVKSWNKNGDKFISMLKYLNNLPHIPSSRHVSRSCTVNHVFVSTMVCGIPHSEAFGEEWGVCRCFVRIVLTRNAYIQSLTMCNQTIETSVLQIDCNGDSFVVFAIYRPHSDTIEHFNHTIEAMLHDDVLKGMSLVLLGDINIDLLKYCQLHVEAFSNIMHSLSFTLVITKSTRFAPPGSDIAPSLFDHIWISKLGSYISGIILIDNSDHYPAFLKLPINGNNCNKIKLCFRNHSPDCIAKFKRDIPALFRP